MRVHAGWHEEYLVHWDVTVPRAVDSQHHVDTRDKADYRMHHISRL